MTATSPQSGWSLGAERALPSRDASANPERALSATKDQALLENPLTRYYRAPLARVFARWLRPSPVLPTQLISAEPLLAALAGYLVMAGDMRRIVLAAALFELRALLAVLVNTLALERGTSELLRARRSISNGIGILFLYLGVFWHFHLDPPAFVAWGLVAFFGSASVAWIFGMLALRRRSPVG